MILRALPKVFIAGLLVISTAGHTYSSLGFSPAAYSGRNGVVSNTGPCPQNLVLVLTDAPADGGFMLNQDTPNTGTRILHPIIVGAAQPLTSSWDDLSAGQKNSLRLHYDSLPTTDEPPFPVGGLYSVYRPISDIVNSPRDQMSGALSMGVLVKPDGQVARVNVYSNQALAATPAIVAQLERLRFKPGRCQGQPCQMEFPVEFAIVAWR